MQFLPWRNVADWRCLSCGDCCRLYTVVIDFGEWLRIVRDYGVGNTVAGLDKLYIKRRADGSCNFLGHPLGVYRCGLQHTKPKACQLWPFRILSMPKHGYAEAAAYQYGEMKLFVYVDSSCSGIRYGAPTPSFINGALKEFVDIAMDTCNFQFRSTGHSFLPRPVLSF